jgi:hypothetical protein
MWTGRITAKLVDKKGITMLISSNRGGAAKDGFQLGLAPEGGYQKGEEFVKMNICARPAIDNAHTLWQQIGE